MNTYSLISQAPFNKFLIKGQDVEEMHFFAEGRIIVTHARGWIGDNNHGNTALEAIEFVNKRKVDLNLSRSFFVGSSLYIHTGELPGFIFHGEELASAQELDDHYGDFITFEYSHTSGTWGAEVKARKFMTSYYTRIELTPLGEQVKAITDLLEGALPSRAKLSRYDVEELVKVKDKLIPLLQEIKL